MKAGQIMCQADINNSFWGNCYACNNFGHIARNCKLLVPIGKYITSQSRFYKKKVTRSNPKGRNYNFFAPL